MKKLYVFLPLFTLIIFLELLSRFGALPRLFLATFTEIGVAFVDIVSEGKLVSDIVATLYKTFVGLTLGSFFGVLAGLYLGLVPMLGKIIFPYLDFFRSVPVTSFYSIFILLLGINDNSKIGTIGWGTFFIMTLSSFYGVSYISNIRTNTIKLLNLDFVTKLTKVILPASLPHIISALRTSTSYALVLATVSEMFLGGSSGLGKQIIDSQLNYNIAELWVYILVLGMIGFTVNHLLILIEKKILWWW